jgi:hypothetical protein
MQIIWIHQPFDRLDEDRLLGFVSEDVQGVPPSNEYHAIGTE